MYIAYIMRGVSGSGKTTLARILAGDYGKIHSTFDLMVEQKAKDEVPKDKQVLEEENFQNFCESLRERVPVVICDNINLHYFQWERYQEAAEKEGYRVAIVNLPHPNAEEAARNNLRGFTVEHIENMIRDFNFFSRQ